MGVIYEQRQIGLHYKSKLSIFRLKTFATAKTFYLLQFTILLLIVFVPSQEIKSKTAHLFFPLQIFVSGSSASSY